GRSIFVLTLLSGVAGLATWGTRLGLEQVFGIEGFINRLAQLAIASAIGLIVFSLGTLALRIPEATILVNRVRSRLTRR
ncbi:MAG: lipid II flippase MurJ, partial [Cyanobacteria bacterium P01_H01_bin.152]